MRMRMRMKKTKEEEEREWEQWEISQHTIQTNLHLQSDLKLMDNDNDS
jgi:hypothetical protein